MPEARQRVLDARPGAQRDRPLQRVAALQDRDLHEASRRRSGTTLPEDGSAVGLRARRLRAGERAVERDLLGDDLADPPHALADVVLADAGEVQPHLRAAAPVEVRGAAGDERDVLAQGAGQQVGRVDVVRQLRPDEQPALRARVGRLAREELLERGEHRVAPAPVERPQRAEVGAPVAVLEVGGRRSTGSAATSTGRRPACRGSAARGSAPGRRPSRAAARRRGSSRTCRGR